MPPSVLRIMRVARVLRILRLLKNLKGLRDLVMTLVFAFPSLVNVATLLALTIFMYAVLGMNMFTYVMHGEDLSDVRNFESFPRACLLLFQSLTGDGWSNLMNDCMVNEERGCNPERSPSDCGSPLALPYFISFVVIGSFVFLNIVVAVILDNFTTLGNQNPDLVSASDIVTFREEWRLYDPDANGKIPTKDLPTFVMSLKAPLGLADSELLHGREPRKNALRFCLGLGLIQEEGQVKFKDVLDALIKANYASKSIVIGEPPTSVGSPDGLAKLITPAGPITPAFASALTPRRREVASVFSIAVISQFIHRIRDRSPDGKLRWRRSGGQSPSLSRSPSRRPSPAPSRSGAPGRSPTSLSRPQPTSESTKVESKANKESRSPKRVPRPHPTSEPAKVETLAKREPPSPTSLPQPQPMPAPSKVESKAKRDERQGVRRGCNRKKTPVSTSAAGRDPLPDSISNPPPENTTGFGFAGWCQSSMSAAAGPGKQLTFSTEEAAPPSAPDGANLLNPNVRDRSARSSSRSPMRSPTRENGCDGTSSRGSPERAVPLSPTGTTILSVRDLGTLSSRGRHTAERHAGMDPREPWYRTYSHFILQASCATVVLPDGSRRTTHARASVTVPEGVHPGMVVTVRSVFNRDRTFKLRMPKGVQPGDVLDVADPTMGGGHGELSA